MSPINLRKVKGFSLIINIYVSSSGVNNRILNSCFHFLISVLFQIENRYTAMFPPRRTVQFSSVWYNTVGNGIVITGVKMIPLSVKQVG